MKLRIMKPAPASSTSVSARLTTMRAPVQRRARTPPDPMPRPPSLSTSLTLVFDTCSAGARPKMMPVARRDGGEEREDGAVHPEVHVVRLADVLRRGIEQVDADDRQREAEDAADQRQQHALDEQLADDAPARRAERHADADLARAVRGAREQQVGDVRARDQQHERDRAHQRPEHDPDLPAVLLLVVGDDPRRDVLVGRRIVVGEPRDDRRQLGLRLRGRDAVGEASDHVVVSQLPRPGPARASTGPSGARYRCWAETSCPSASRRRRSRCRSSTLIVRPIIPGSPP